MKNKFNTDCLTYIRAAIVNIMVLTVHFYSCSLFPPTATLWNSIQLMIKHSAASRNWPIAGVYRFPQHATSGPVLTRFCGQFQISNWVWRVYSRLLSTYQGYLSGRRSNWKSFNGSVFSSSCQLLNLCWDCNYNQCLGVHVCNEISCDVRS